MEEEHDEEELDPIVAMRGELEAARAENHMLIEQMTRLCLYIENSTGVDPIEVMHGRAPPPEPRRMPSPPSQPSPQARDDVEERGWIRGLLSRTGLSGERDAGLSGERGPKPVRGASSAHRARASHPDAIARDPIASEAIASEGGTRGAVGAGAAATAEEEEDEEPPTIIAGGTFEWRGDPEAMGELERKLMESRSVAEVSLDGTGLTRLPSALPMWSHLGRTLTQISLNGNGLLELPLAFSKLRNLRRLFLEGNLLRELPPPVLSLVKLEELGMGCNQLTGLPEGIGSLRKLAEVWLVSNEISYLPQSFGQLTRLRKLELSANALHELPRSFGKLTGLTHLWMSGNSLSIFPQHLCALDQLELLDLHSNSLMSIPRAVATMPALKTLMLANNPLSFPPPGVVAQGPAAVLDYIRRHRHTDLMTTDAERSLKQVLAHRERLATSVDAHEESYRHHTGGSKTASPRATAPPDLSESEPVESRLPPMRPEADAAAEHAQQSQNSPPRRSRNAGFFQ